jgi:hypothetical protein
MALRILPSNSIELRGLQEAGTGPASLNSAAFIGTNPVSTA